MLHMLRLFVGVDFVVDNGPSGCVYRVDRDTGEPVDQPAIATSAEVLKPMAGPQGDGRSKVKAFLGKRNKSSVQCDLHQIAAVAGTWRYYTTNNRSQPKREPDIKGYLARYPDMDASHRCSMYQVRILLGWQLSYCYCYCSTVPCNRLLHGSGPSLNTP